MNIEKVCILCSEKNKGDGLLVFFAKTGVDVSGLSGEVVGYYYFAENKKLTCDGVRPKGRTLINPWAKPRRKFPREMMVSDDKKNWFKWKVFGRLTNSEKPYLTAFVSRHKYQGWRYAKEIE